MKIDNVLYYYITNLQGDVMQIVNSNGTAVASYEYDPYGNIISATGSLAEINPLRYRGYVYDPETSLYYINSRYYDPSVGRFVSADALISTGQGLLGNDMYAYCRNNPVCRIDITGYADEEADLDGETKDDLFPDPMGGGGDGQPPTGTASGSGGGGSNGGGSGSTSTGGAQSAGKGFSSFKALKSYLGSPGENKHWHHVVEQCQSQKSGFTSEQINNTSNVVAVDAQTHAMISGYYDTTTFPFTNGTSVRNWLAGQPYEVQFEFGMGVLQQFGVIY